MDRYTFYVLEFLEGINPASQTNMNDLVSIHLIWVQRMYRLILMWKVESAILHHQWTTVLDDDLWPFQLFKTYCGAGTTIFTAEA